MQMMPRNNNFLALIKRSPVAEMIAKIRSDRYLQAGLASDLYTKYDGLDKKLMALIKKNNTNTSSAKT